MKVAHLSCGVEGGADIAAVRIHRALQRRGVESRFYHLGHDGIDQSFTKFYESKSFAALVGSRINNYRQRFLYGSQSPDCEAFTKPFGNYPLTFNDLAFHDVDVICFHWIAAFFDLVPFLESVPSHVRFVWALHDLNPFTGGCHYTMGCRKFEKECIACPQRRNDGLIDLARKNFTIKKDAYDRYLRGRMVLIADSHWLEHEANVSSLLKGVPSETIHYPIETEIFKRQEKRAIRKLLSLQDDTFTLMFGSGSIHNKRKGLDLLLGALRLVSQRSSRPLQLITFGSGRLDSVPGVTATHFGRVSQPAFLSILYNASDCFVAPSREEALGQTAMEALCCGTPVIAFNTGGLKDTVNRENGILVENINEAELADAIERACQIKFDAQEISRQASAMFSEEVKSQQYLRAFERAKSL